ncbi:MAG: hypothetical protein SH807_06380 [Blastochloris sp.]|nr:hypothetical protein [Blastochloris sp.]
MKFTFSAIALLAFSTLCSSSATYAADKEPVKIIEIKLETVNYPKEVLAGGGNKTLDKDWYQIEVKFSTDEELTEELQVKIFMEGIDFMKEDDFVTLVCEQTFINVPEGKEHYAYAYLSPGSALRYGGKKGKDVKDSNVHVDILVNGRSAAKLDFKKGSEDNWHSSGLQVPSVLVPLTDSPFWLSLVRKVNQSKPKN